MAKQRKFLTYYPQFFFFQALFRTISWLIFLPLFTVIGKRYANTDILGKICQTFGKDWNFSQYFIGNSEEKFKLLNYAFYFILLIIGLNFLSLLINRYLWKKDRYIENNNFYLHNKWIFILNSLIYIASAILLTLSLISAFTAILALIFITFNSFTFAPAKKAKKPQIETFFSWKNPPVRKILLYSALVIFIVPLVIGYYQKFHETAMGDSPEGFAKVYQELINTSPAIKGIAGLILKTNYSLFHWFILIWFLKGLIGERWKEFGDFWTKINGIEKRVSNFKHYYYYQESWALANGTPINLSDYSYLESNPNFLGKSFLENDLDIDQFAQQNKKVIKHIEFCSEKIKESAKRNFLNYCLFNEFSSWNDCVRTRKLIKATRK